MTRPLSAGQKKPLIFKGFFRFEFPGRHRLKHGRRQFRSTSPGTPRRLRPSPARAEPPFKHCATTRPSSLLHTAACAQPDQRGPVLAGRHATASQHFGRHRMPRGKSAGDILESAPRVGGHNTRLTLPPPRVQATDAEDHRRAMKPSHCQTGFLSPGRARSRRPRSPPPHQRSRPPHLPWPNRSP